MRFGRSTGPADVLYAECESSTAGPITPSHLVRHAPGVPLLRGGGLNVRSLCGRDIEGWHTGAIYNVDEAKAFRESHVPGTPGALCSNCVDALSGS